MLGFTYKDKITGFTGVCTGTVQYISGCNQVLLSPKGDKEARWFDVQRVERTSTKRIELENGANPGHDLAAPVR